MVERPDLVRQAWFILAAGLLVGCGSRSPARTSPARIPLTVLQDSLAVCRAGTSDTLPAWAAAGSGEFFSVTRTEDEVSIILSESRPPSDARCERDWRLLKVRGPLPFNLVGIVAGLSGTLADAGVSIFALSTYDTDYIMVKQPDLDRAVQALRRAGYSIAEPERRRAGVVRLRGQRSRFISKQKQSR